MARGPRTRLRQNVYQDRYGYATSVTVAGQTREHRWSFGTPIEVMQRWVTDTRHAMQFARPKVARGTLQADADRYSAVIRDLASFVARRSEIRAWVKALGAGTHRARVTHEDIRRIRGDWLAAGVAPKTINNRVFALQHLYRELDGRTVPTPCDELRPLPVHRRPAVRIPDALVRAIYQNLLEHERRGLLRDAKTRARFMVFASTGHRPSEIGRAEPGDLDIERRIWTPRDGKGGFCPGVYLNDDMREAWRLFVAADAWGRFDSGSFAKRIRSAGLPDHLTPYQLRHTIGIALSEAGADLRDIGDHLGHKRVETTRRHYVPVLGSRLQRLSESLDGRQLGWQASDPSPRLAPAAGTNPVSPTARTRKAR